ncbi:hypothetical protein HAX54_040144 [Datura stramonium]|uniref:Uncharacterized protein n=1 Tax=Datura stramonium TaxID=4076 RepID=A0ABS8VM86_DATST|nr:hypothetical protein [Datura stramonium]
MFHDDLDTSAYSTLAFIEGIVVLKTSNSEDKSVAGSSESAFYANLLDNGNFVLYNQDHETIYETFNAPTNTILGGQSLPSGVKLVSSFSSTNHSSGRFHLLMQNNSNLVAYPENLNQPVDAYWASKIYYTGCRNHLVSGGLNSYYVRNDHNAPSCMCLPGLYLRENDPSFGDSQRNFTSGNCIAGKEDASVYKISPTTNLTWEDPPYLVTSFLGKEDCGKSCLEDCACDAALFGEIGQCMKHELL